MKRAGHDEIRDLLGVYALDALDADERLRVEQHLQVCADCEEEAREHLETAALLGSHPDAVPPALWSSIADALPAHDAEVREFPLVRGTSGVSRWRWATAAVAVAAAVFAGVAASAIQSQRQLEDRVDNLAGQLDDVGLEQAAARAAAADDARTVDLRSADEGTSVRLVHLSDGTGYLVEDNLDALPDDRTYQLWALEGEAKISAAVLGPDPGVTAFTVDAAVDGFAITAEQRGGSVAPTSDPVVVGFT